MDIEEAIKVVGELVLEGELDRALALLDEAIEAHPEAEVLYIERGDLLGLASKKVLALKPMNWQSSFFLKVRFSGINWGSSWMSPGR
jgi:hypothetical protein